MTGTRDVGTGARAQQRDWEEIAAEDPLWAILSDAGRKFGGWDREAFFRTGRVEVDDLMARIERFGLPTGHGRALDFGCGVGRITRALAQHFAECVGVDISPRMIDQARELNCDQPRCRFLVNRGQDLAGLQDASFDLVYTRIVLQHLPDRNAIETYLAEFVRTLRSGGLLVFQLPSALPLQMRLQPRRSLYRALRRVGVPSKTLYWRLGLHPMRMRSLAVPEVRAFLAARGATVLDVDTHRHGSLPFEDSIYFVTVG
jgi:SAM-dependent methyltransferase